MNNNNNMSTNSVLKHIHQVYCDDFENLFSKSENCELTVSQEVKEVKEFTDKHSDIFKLYEMVLTKNSGIILYGPMYQVYLKSKRFLNCVDTI